MPRRQLLATFAIATIGALVGGSTVAWANHQFNDVPSGSFFHGAIGAIVDSGCATGFSDGTFKPSQSPTRGQFAYWTNNCGGRMSFDEGSTFALNGVSRTLATASIAAGAVGSGRGKVLIHAAGWTKTAGDGEGCPCLIEASIVRPGSGDNTAYERLPFGDEKYASFAILDTLTVDAGQTVTVSLVADRVDGTAVPQALGQLALTYFPFDGDGTGP